MKVAGGMLMGLGAMMVALAFMYNNSTGKSSPMMVILGILLFFIGLVLFNIKPKDKN